MAEFQDVLHQWRRLCDKYHSCDKCPGAKTSDKESICMLMSYDNRRTEAEVEDIIMSWAAEHPIVYPTWWEWLASIGAVTRKVKPDVASELIETGLLDPIPADIAQKLGIEPKEGV